MSPSAEYKYYAFISYSRKNSQAAAFLHKGFERFRIPLSKIPAEHLPPDNRYLRPIFRDKRNLEVSENNFSDDIRRALETSKYLIVICSPEAAGSKWVEKEIRCFLKTHNNNLGAIIPIIFKGHPGSGDQNECLPSVLNCEEICHRNLPRMMPDEGETDQQAWQNGMIQAISYMLHVKPESIKNSIDAERIRFYQRCIFIAIVTLLIFIGLASWALIAQKGKLLAEAETARMIEIAQKTVALRKKAEENEKRAIAGEKEARRQAAIAKKNEAEAKRQAGIAKKNEAEAKRQEGIAKKNEAEAKRQAAIAESSLEFLRYVFQSSDPTCSGNKDVKVIDAINAKIPVIYKIIDWEIKASIALIVGQILNSHARFDEALKLLKMSVSLYEEYDPGSRKLALSYNNIGSVYDNLGNYTAALDYYQKSLAIRKKTLPENHPSIATSYNNIGSVYSKQGNYTAALDNYQKALTIQKKTLPENHPDIAQSYNNIGTVYYRKGNYAVALKNYQISLAIQKKILPGTHPSIAISYHNIGLVYDSQGNYTAALEYFQKALTIRKKVLPENHPDVAQSYNHIGAIYFIRGNYAAALDYYQTALAIFKKRLPENHPSIATSYNNIGSVYSKQGNYTAALDNFQKALTIQKKVLPENHPDIAHSYNNIGVMYFRMGEYRNAYNYIKKAYEILRSNLGDKHPTTQQTLNALKFVEQKLKENKK